MKQRPYEYLARGSGSFDSCYLQLLTELISSWRHHLYLHNYVRQGVTPVHYPVNHYFVYQHLITYKSAHTFLFNVVTYIVAIYREINLCLGLLLNCYNYFKHEKPFAVSLYENRETNLFQYMMVYIEQCLKHCIKKKKHLIFFTPFWLVIFV